MFPHVNRGSQKERKVGSVKEYDVYQWSQEMVMGGQDIVMSCCLHIEKSHNETLLHRYTHI